MEYIVYPFFLLRVLGVPFSWPNLAMGFVVNWIGLEVNVREWSLGLSARRAAWVTGWLEAKLAAGKVRIGELVQALGRMQLAYGVLRWDRPFLAPLYTLASSYDPDATVPLPPFVAAAMQWLRDRLLVRRTAPCRRIEVSKKGVFRVDAKAEGPNVALGGWRPVAGPDGEIDLMAFPWFALTLTPAEAPWAFDRGEPLSGHRIAGAAGHCDWPDALLPGCEDGCAARGDRPGDFTHGQPRLQRGGFQRVG